MRQYQDAQYYDFFMSYHHGDLQLVESIVSVLEEYGYRCWYAPRDVEGSYAKSIVKAISHSRTFLLMLNRRSAVSNEVLNELETAHNISKQYDMAKIQPVLLEPIDYDEPEYAECLYHIRRIHFIKSEKNDGLLEDIMSRFPKNGLGQDDRTRSDYRIQRIEDHRLKDQNDLLEMFDGDVYDSVFAEFENPKVLDLGCGVGDMIMAIIQKSKCFHLVGLDWSKRLVDIATSKYSAKNTCFYTCDIEGEELESTLADIMEAHCIDGFDIINISMVLLHLQSPYKLLKRIRNTLSDDGVLVIRDIDDGINFAYSDPDGSFERTYKICSNDDQSGMRRTRRQVYHDFINAGYSNIRLEKQGLSTIGMNDSQRRSLFNIYFPFTYQNSEIMHIKYPRVIEYHSDYEWLKSKYDEIRAAFMEKDFCFSLGFQLYTARK